MSQASTVSQSFRDRADRACFYEAWAGAVLSRAGLYTTHCPFLIDGKDHGQSFDLQVSSFNPQILTSTTLISDISDVILSLRAEKESSPGVDGSQAWSTKDQRPTAVGPPKTDLIRERCVTVEVKALSLSFSSPSDYQYESVIVCSQNSFLRKWPGRSDTGRDFLFVSMHTGSIVWLPKGSPVTLGNETLDSTRGELYKTVRTPKSHLCSLHMFTEYVHGH